MAHDIVSLDMVKREAHAAAERGLTPVDACRWPFASAAGQAFKQFFHEHKAALAALGQEPKP